MRKRRRGRKQRGARLPSGTNCARSVPEAADRLGVSVRTVWARIADGTYRAVKPTPGRTTLTDRELDRILAGDAEEAAR
jgi:excisionase family DNA binding protein